MGAGIGGDEEGKAGERGDAFAVQGAQLGQFGEELSRRSCLPPPGCSAGDQAGPSRNRCLKSVSIFSIRLSSQAV
jgi:hypothetical protein